MYGAAKSIYIDEFKAENSMFTVFLLFLSAYQVILIITHSFIPSYIGGVMVSMVTSSVVDHGLEPRLGQTKDYNIGICCFSAKHTALRKKSKD